VLPVKRHLVSGQTYRSPYGVFFPADVVCGLVCSVLRCWRWTLLEEWLIFTLKGSSIWCAPSDWTNEILHVTYKSSVLSTSFVFGPTQRLLYLSPLLLSSCNCLLAFLVWLSPMQLPASFLTACPGRYYKLSCTSAWKWCHPLQA
jgi:hypothetical protein